MIEICGGYQMLGKLVEDPAAVESQRSRIEGLGLLPVKTVFDPRKRLVRVEAECLLPGLEGVLVRGYEIHQGRSHIEGAASPAFRIRWEFGGGADAIDGAALGVECFGTYLHGLFDHVAFRRGYLNAVRARKGLEPLPVHAYDTRPKDFDQLADWLRDSVDMAALERVVGLPLRTTIGDADPAPPNKER